MQPDSPPRPPLDLDAIRARADKATPGPWIADVTEIYGPGHGWVGETLRLGEDYYIGDANAEFIAHAREDIPALLAEVTALRAELDAVQGARLMDAIADELGIGGDHA